MNTDKIYAEQLANEYAPKDTSKVVALRKLDAKAKLPATIFTYSFGIIASLVTGIGMCLSMKVIGSGATAMFVLGIIIGIVGLLGMGINYPIYKKLLESGRVDRVEAKSKPKGLSAKTVRNIHQMISSACGFAVNQKLLASNSACACALPRIERKEMKTIPPDKLTSFFDEAKESGVFELYYIDLLTGLRRGELLGLKWDDVDLKNGILHVRRQIMRQNGAVVEAPLKTKNSYRSIAIPADAVEVLKTQREKVGCGSEYVFPSPTGGPISPDSVLHMLQRVLKRAGLERVRFHDLRHTFATLALQNGVDVKTVSGMLGHYSAGFTLDTYAHVTTAAQRTAANTMGNILSGAVR